MSEHRWNKNNSNYILEDSNGNVLLEVEDRTCNRSYVTESVLNSLASQYLKDLEKETKKYENGTTIFTNET